VIFYREGFETVVYLQALRVSGSAGAVYEGFLAGTAATLLLALLMLRLRRRLPYRAIVVVTAGLIAVLVVVMAGQAARVAQGAGWLGITSLDWRPPAWTGQWLGLYGSTQTLLAQALAAVVVAALGLAVGRRRIREQSRRIERARASRRSAPVTRGA
jgi:high-affinity iron transporter